MSDSAASASVVGASSETPSARHIAPELLSLARSISTLREDPQNARAHPEKNLEAIKDSLRRFSQQKPIVVARDGTVIAGNGTLAAAKALGWTHLACVVTNLDVDAARAF